MVCVCMFLQHASVDTHTHSELTVLLCSLRDDRLATEPSGSPSLQQQNRHSLYTHALCHRREEVGGERGGRGGGGERRWGGEEVGRRRWVGREVLALFPDTLRF